MELLGFINSYIIYLYLIISVPLLFFIIKLLKELLSIIKGISLIKKKTNGLKDKMEVINQKKEKIDYTSKHSLPLFTNTILVVSALKALLSKKRKKKQEMIKRTGEIINLVGPLMNIMK